MTDDLVSEAMEEDVSSELPCTLAIESPAHDTTELTELDQVSFSCCYSQIFSVVWHVLLMLY